MRTCRSLFLSLLWLAPVHAAITNVRVLGTTTTQAVIAYTAPSLSACAVEVSESSALVPLVNDVNAVLFPGANLDSRAGSTSNANGLMRVFVAGKRAAELATDGKYYSRALQAYTTHYYRITCGSDSASGSFQTQNLPLGSTYNDPYPRDPDRPGQYAWPTLDYTYPTSAGNGGLSTNGTAVTFATDETLQPSDYIVLTSGPNTGQQRQVAAVADSRHVTLVQAFSRNQSAGTLWGRRTPEKTSTQKIVDPQNGLLLRRISNAQQYQVNGYAVALTTVAPGPGWNNASTTSLGAADSNAASYTGDSDRSWLFVHAPTGFTSYNEGYTQMDWVTVTLQGSGDGSGDDNAIEMCLTADGTTCRSAILQVDLATCAPWAKVGSQCWVGTEVPLEAAWQSPSDAVGSLLDPVEMNAATGGILIRKKTATSNTINLDYLAVNLGISTPGEEFAMGAQVCSNALAPQTYSGATRQGYRCVFGTTQAFAYWIDSTTGDSVVSAQYRDSATRKYVTAAGANFDQTDASKLYGPGWVSGVQQIVQTDYPGQNLDTGFLRGGAVFNGKITPLSGDLPSAMAAFSPDFNAHKSYWGVGNIGIYGMLDNRYIHVQFFPPSPAYTQGVLAYKGIFDVQTRRFVAGTPTVGYYPSRWCQMHTGGTGGDGLGWANVSSTYQDSGSLCGLGPFQTELAEDFGVPNSGTGRDVACPNPMLSIARSSSGGVSLCASVLVTGDMYRTTPCASENSNRGINGFLGDIQAARPGDILTVGSEHLQLLSKDPACSDPNAQCRWTVLRGVDGAKIAAHASGAAVVGTCAAYSFNAADVYWDFLDDPYGTDETMTYKKFFANAHGTAFVAQDAGSLLGIRVLGSNCGLGGPGCYAAFSGSMKNISSDWLSGRYPHAINYQPHFAGLMGQPAYPDAHPSLRQTNDFTWILDGRPYYGPISQTWTQVSGSLYKTSTGLNQKLLPTEASCAAKPAVDVTPGPITADASDAYKFCNGSGCYPGAGPNDIFLNCPDATTLSCSADTSDDTKDMCVHDLSSIGHTYMQIGITPVRDRAGAYIRLFGTPLGRFRRDSIYRNMNASPDGKWGFFLAHWLDGMRSENMALKLPPWPPKDSLDRSTFLPLRIQLTSVPPGTDNVIAEFGYDTEFHCTSRREACIAASSTVNESNPFYWASEAYSGVRAPWTITIPTISQRVVYCRLKYRDASNNVIKTGPTQVWTSD
jgi:hypothetical protein